MLLRPELMRRVIQVSFLGSRLLEWSYYTMTELVFQQKE